MWLTERTLLELAYGHQADMARAHPPGYLHQIEGPPAVLPQSCCRFLAHAGHRLMLMGLRMETRYAQRPAAA